MKRQQNIWTHDARIFLYEQLTRRFGPYAQWEKSGKPGHHDREFAKFCKEFANVVGATSEKAVRQQIYFSLPVKGRARWRNGHSVVAVHNLSAALEAKFISHGECPNLVATKSSRILTRRRKP